MKPMTLTRGLTAALLLSGVLATTAIAGDALAEAPATFGPIESRTFAWKPGTAIERPADTVCHNNADYLIVRGPNVANVKSIDVSPKVLTWERQQAIPSINTCAAGDNNCLQIMVKVTRQDAPGARTVTLKHADGRTLTTTFDIVPNAGRCDYGKGNK
jgi:hypothetical protein